MEITITVPELELWQWCVLAALTWYVLAALLIRYTMWGRQILSDGDDEMGERIVFWLFSPVVAVVGVCLVLPFFIIGKFLDSSGKK